MISKAKYPIWGGEGEVEPQTELVKASSNYERSRIASENLSTDRTNISGSFCTFAEPAAASQKFSRLRSPRMGNCTDRNWRGGGGGGLRSFLCGNALSNIPQALSTRQEMIGEFAYSR